MAILQDEKLAGVIGGSGGMYIIPAVAQVFINHFILGMDPPNAVQSPRVYHKVLPIFFPLFLFHLKSEIPNHLCITESNWFMVIPNELK